MVIFSSSVDIASHFLLLNLWRVFSAIDLNLSVFSCKLSFVVSSIRTLLSAKSWSFIYSSPIFIRFFYWFYWLKIKAITRLNRNGESIYPCVCPRAHTQKHTLTHTPAHNHAHTQKHTLTHSLTHTHAHTHTQTLIKNTLTDIHSNINTHTCSQTYILKHIHAYSHTHYWIRFKTHMNTYLYTDT